MKPTVLLVILLAALAQPVWAEEGAPNAERMQAFCQDNPQRCERLKQMRQRCQENPEQCQQARERVKQFREKCAADPQRCEEMRAKMKERGAEGGGFRGRFGQGGGN